MALVMVPVFAVMSSSSSSVAWCGVRGDGVQVGRRATGAHRRVRTSGAGQCWRVRAGHDDYGITGRDGSKSVVASWRAWELMMRFGSLASDERNNMGIPM